MKKYILSVVAGIVVWSGLAAGTAQAAPETNLLSSNFVFEGLYSPSNSPVMKTNAIGNVITSTYTSKPLLINNKTLLDILAAEFGTTLPTGARLAYSLDADGFVVVDAQNNLILNATSNALDTNYFFSLTNISSYSESTSGKGVETITASATNTTVAEKVVIGDEAIYYSDKKGNNFHFSGAAVEMLTEVEKGTNNPVISASVSLHGSGGGIFYNSADGSYDEGVFTSASWIAIGKDLTF